jgi:hypothetical protein
LGGRGAGNVTIMKRTVHKLDEETFLRTYSPATQTTTSSATAFAETAVQVGVGHCATAAVEYIRYAVERWHNACLNVGATNRYKPQTP